MKKPILNSLLGLVGCLTASFCTSTLQAQTNILYVGDNTNNQSAAFWNGTNSYSAIFVGVNEGDSNNSILVVNPGTLLETTNSSIWIGASGSGNTITVTNGASMIDAGLGLGIGVNATSSNNSLLVTGTGSTVISSISSILVGYSGSGNSMSVMAGGAVTTVGVFLGQLAGSSNNSLLVDGTGSILNSSFGLLVGMGGGGNTVVISNGGNLITTGAFGGTIGLSGDSPNNSVLVTGAGSSWSNGISGEGPGLYVGDGGSGNSLVISDGGSVVSSNNFVIGTNSSSSSNNSVLVTGAGSTLNNNGNLVVGSSSSGNSMVVSDGGTVVNSQEWGIGISAQSSSNSVLVTGTGSSWTNSGDLLVGVSGSGNSLVVNNGASVASGQATNGGVIGLNAGSVDNSVLVTGAGSTWTNSGKLTIGDAGSGTLTIANAASVSAYDVLIASQVGSSGTLNFGSLGGSDAEGNFLYSGIGFGSGDGTINFNQTNAVAMTGLSGTGSVNQLGNGTTLLFGTSTYAGTTTVNGGTLQLDGQASIGSSSVILNGGTLVAEGVFTGSPFALNGGTLLLTGAASSWNTEANTLFIGNNSPEVTMDVLNGASVTSRGAILGNNATSSNNTILVSGNGSTLNSSGNLMVGNVGSGNTLNVSNGGQVVSSGAYSYIGASLNSSNNNVLVTGAGSTWSNSGIIEISQGTTATGNSLTVANGGSVTASTLGIAQYFGGASGALNIGRLGSNDTAGTVSAGSIDVGTGGAINFNQSDTTTMSSSIIGWNTGGALRQQGIGTTILTGNNHAYNGATTVSAGTLLANSSNSLGTSTVTVTNTGTLGGNGSIHGATTIASGGTLAPGSSGVGSLSFTGGLTLAAGSTTTFQIHSTGDFTSINLLGGSVTYGGVLLFDLIDFTPVAGSEFAVFNRSGGATESGSFSSVLVEGNYLSDNDGVWSGSYGGMSYQFAEATGDFSVQSVPEPSTYALIGIGALALVIAYRRRRRA